MILDLKKQIEYRVRQSLFHQNEKFIDFSFNGKNWKSICKYNMKSDDKEWYHEFQVFLSQSDLLYYYYEKGFLFLLIEMLISDWEAKMRNTHDLERR